MPSGVVVTRQIKREEWLSMLRNNANGHSLIETWLLEVRQGIDWAVTGYD